jgi:hypothetical protein
MPARFVVKKGTTGKFRFVLVAANGEPIATSELYNTKTACLGGIRAVRRVAGDAAVDDLTKAPPKTAAKGGAKKAAAKASPAKKSSARKTSARSGGRRRTTASAPASEAGGAPG